MIIATPAHSKTNAANRADHSSDCVAVVNAGSTTNGYETSARSEPRFESEYSRYGDWPSWVRLNQPCTSGPVDDKMK